MSSEGHESVSTETAGSPRWVGLAVAVLAVVSVFALGMGWNASRQAKTAEEGLKADVSALKQDNTVLQQRLGKAEETNAQVQGELSVVTDRLKLTQGELTRARQQTKLIRQEYGKELSQLEANVKGELANKASTDEVKAVSNDVQGVRSDLEGEKQNLQMARGEMGTLIARNHDEIEQLRRLGERDYYEFTLDGKGKRQKVGDMMVELRGANSKRHQFSVALFVDDMRLEKKNRSINEPIYFYTRGRRAPLELVVNQISGNRIVGYVSVPKVNEQPAQASGS